MPNCLPRNVLQMCTQTSRVCKSPRPYTPQHRVLSFCFLHLLPISLVRKKSILLLFAFAFVWSAGNVEHLSYIYQPLVVSSFVCSFVRFPIEEPIFSLMIYKSSKCTCFPEAGPSCAPQPLWLLCRCTTGATSLHGHRCPGLSEERTGESVAMAMLPKQALAAVPLAEWLSWPWGRQPRQTLYRLWGRGQREAHCTKTAWEKAPVCSGTLPCAWGASHEGWVIQTQGVKSIRLFHP